ncbi:DNA recombination and repair protein Rad51-like C-terminal [Trinorchestia longiramus]|nr:DNA recombination and repair protein Rad51-like C-terminal [Trinorchestia longiramus]
MKHQRKLLASCGLSSSIISRLHACNFVHEGDLQDFSPTQLSEATGLSLSESCEVLRLCSSSVPNSGETVLDMIEERDCASHVVTLCPSLDAVLGGGIALGALTEIVGTPGTGKTQLCLQLSVSVQLPKWCHGIDGEAVFIDTEGSFVTSRLVEIAEAAIAHCNELYTSQSCQAAEGSTPLKLESILRNINYYRCLTQLSVTSCIKLLPALLSQRPRIRIIIIDSIAFHLRHDIPDNRLRTSYLYSMTQDLIQLATKHQVAVVLINHMTTRVPSQATTDRTSKSIVRRFPDSDCVLDPVRTSRSSSTQSKDDGVDVMSQRKSECSSRRGGAVSEVASEPSGTVDGSLNASLTPALGESWGHCASIRLLLHWQHGRRAATLLKSPHTATGTTYYAVTAAGIRGVSS